MDLQVVFGTGPVGLHCAQELLSKGYTVRLVNRSGKLSASQNIILSDRSDSNVEISKAEGTDLQQVLAAAEGATHIFHCMNPLYHQWAEILPRVQENMIEAAVRNNAVLTVSENLYMYKRGTDIIDLHTEISPPTKKGAIRARLHNELVKAGVERNISWSSVRASDFYGPGSIDQSVFGTKYFLDPLANGKKPVMLGNPDAVHSYTYVGDFGRALALVAHTPEAFGRPWIVSHIEKTTSRSLAEKFMKHWNKESKISLIPNFIIRMMGLFNPVMREVPEMLYQKEESYRVDSSEFNKAFNFTPTDLETGVRNTIAWYESYITEV